MATRQYELVSLLKTPISLLFSKLVLTTAMMEKGTSLSAILHSVFTFEIFHYQNVSLITFGFIELGEFDTKMETEECCSHKATH